MDERDRSSTRRGGAAWLAALVLLAPGCGSDNPDTDAFVVQESGFVGVRDPRNLVVGDLALFLASEADQAGGVDLNEDGTVGDDLVAIAVRFDLPAVQNLGAAPLEMAIAGPYALLVVDEAGNRDWNSNGLDERVLLRWLVGSEAPEFVAVLDPDSPRGVVATSVAYYYAVDEDPAGASETNLRVASVFDVDAPEVISTDGVSLFEGRVGLLGASNGLVLVAVDETDPSSQGDANGDTDTLDPVVLALIEEAAEPPVLVGTGLALPSADAPIEVRFRSGTRYELALLVDESAQGAANLDGDFTPAICAAADGDIDDDVLHLVVFEDGMVTEITNTTIAGAERVFLLDAFIGTLSPEAGIGPDGCDLTNDGQADDTVLRLAPLGLPDQPIDLDTLYLPLATDLPGASFGISVSSTRFVAAVAPEFAVPGLPSDAPALGQFDPALQVTWSFVHGDPDPQAGPLGVTLSWLGPEIVAGRAPLVLLESSLGFSANRGCGLDQKDGGSPDTADALPGALRLTSGGGSVLSGFGLAVDPHSPVQIAFGLAFFRVDEADDGFDWNGDGLLDGSSLFRHSLLACDPVRMADIDGGSLAPIVTDGGRGALLFTDESAVGADLNGDDLIGGLAVRYFRAF